MLTLDPSAVDFNWPNARALLEVCALVYQPPCQTGHAKNHGDIWIEDPRTDAHALIQDRGNCLVVAFRGSKDAEDYVQDGKFEMAELIWTRAEQSVKVHCGFLEDFESLNEGLSHAVKNRLTARQGGLRALPIFITGHSLGGALATLCALEFSRQNLSTSGLYTFGCPRVGNAAFAEIYDGADAYPAADQLGEISYRVVNENDIVPRVPPWMNGYRHVGQNCFLPVGTKSTWIKNPSHAYIALSDALSFWGAFRNLHDVLVHDHHLASYQKRTQLL